MCMLFVERYCYLDCFKKILLCILQVIGWRLVNEDGKLKLQCLWKLRDFECGVELINRIFKAVGSTGHFPNLHLEQSNQVRAELWTSSIGNHHSCYLIYVFVNLSFLMGPFIDDLFIATCRRLEHERFHCSCKN